MKKYLMLTLLSLYTLFASSLSKEKNKEITQNKNTNKIVTQKTKEKDKNVESIDDIIFDWSGTFAEVLQIAKDQHYDISKEKVKSCMIQATNAFLNCLDPHSSFLDPKTYKTILEATSGQFFGIGIIIDNTRNPKNKFLKVINTIPGDPADKAGVKAGDQIMEINEKKLEGMTTEEASAKLRGERNTKVTITVIRDKVKEPLTFEIIRDVIKEQSSLAFYTKKYNIFYVSLATFSKNSVKQIRDILKRTTKKTYSGIILDLRNNSGGLLESVIDIAGLFLDKGSLVAETKDRKGKTTKFRTKEKPVANVKVPIFILVNNYTASASEILAGCLKIHSQKLSEKSGKKGQKRLMVFIAGTRTFGKGSVQTVIPIGNDCAAKLTTSLYFLPDNKTIQGAGIEPDFIIPKLFPPPKKVVWFLENYGREEALKHTIKPKNTNANKKDKKDKKTTETKTWAERIKESLSKDNQFFETIQLINAFDTATKKCHKKINNRQKAIEYLQSIFALNGDIELEQIKI